MLKMKKKMQQMRMQVFYKSLSAAKRRLPCLLGWEMGANCLNQLWFHLHTEYGLKFLLTSRLNQDCVENLFSVIRGKGSQRDNPDAREFRAAFTQVYVMQSAYNMYVYYV